MHMNWGEVQKGFSMQTHRS